MNNVNKVISFFEEYPGHLKTSSREIAERLNVSLSNVFTGRNTYKDQINTISNANDRVKNKIEEEGLYQSFQDFLKNHDINEEDVTNVWFKQKASGTYFSVETRKTKPNDLDEINIIEEFKKSIREYSPPSYPVQVKDGILSDRIGIINLFDAHLDKISSINTTDEESTIEKNIELFESGFDEILDSIASKHPEKIIFPIGNDFWHTNDEKGHTKRGTYVGEAVNVDFRTSFRIGLNLLRRCIDKARSIAPVKIITIRGNHDPDKTMFLLECLLIAFENQDGIEIVDSIKTRQYHRYGSWLFGFAHGDKQRNPKDLPSLMSTDADSKIHWSDINRGVFFLGDLHHEMTYDYRGVTVRYLRSTNPIDTWHWEQGYTAQLKTAYGFVYEKNGSREFEFKVNI